MTIATEPATLYLIMCNLAPLAVGGSLKVRGYEIRWPTGLKPSRPTAGGRMTRTSADVSPDPAVEVRSSTGRFHPLAALLLLAVAIRLPLAFWPNVDHPDEIFQYLEPAWRMLGRDSIVTWEWRDGIRSPFLPSLFVP